MSDEPDTGRPWLRLLVGATAFVTGAIGLAYYLAALGDRADYRRATPCAPGVARRCVTEAGARVVDRYEEWGRKSRYSYLVVSLPGGEREKVTLADPEEVWGRVRAGDTVVVRIWDGNVARVTTADGSATESEDSPLVSPLTGIALGLAFAGYGAYQALSAREMARESWRRAPVPPIRTLSRAAAFAVCAGGVAAFAGVQWLDLYSLPPLALLSTAATVGTLLYLDRRAGREG